MFLKGDRISIPIQGTNGGNTKFWRDFDYMFLKGDRAVMYNTIVKIIGSCFHY